jgi:hypothetical protein
MITTQFFVVVAFVVFMIQMGVTVANYREMLSFEDVLTNDIQNQLKVSHDIQMTMNNTQAVVIASVKSNKSSTDVRAQQFDQLMGRLQVILSNEEMNYSFEKLLPYNLPHSSFEYRPSPLKP